MEIISHRGFWLEPAEKNTSVALHRSLTCNFGTETDLRDLDNALVISHDPPRFAEKLVTFDSVCSLFSNSQLSLAINIKSDGLAKLVAQYFAKYNLKNAFVFDMSLPDTFNYQRLSIPFYVRASEYEQSLSLIEDAAGIWLDGFLSVWYDLQIINTILSYPHLKICIVSSELHGRDQAELWLKLKDWGLHNNDRVMLCTDYPNLAMEFFND